jgi:hypothetical protein
MSRPTMDSPQSQERCTKYKKYTIKEKWKVFAYQLKWLIPSHFAHYNIQMIGNIEAT